MILQFSFLFYLCSCNKVSILSILTAISLSKYICSAFSFDIILPLWIIVNVLRLQLHGAIYRPDSFVMMPRYCANLKAIRYESINLNRMVADKLHRVIVA